MEVKQIYEILNETTKEVLGQEGLVTEDLSNVVSLGTEIFNANAVENYVKTLVDISVKLSLSIEFTMVVSLVS